jgi:5'-3' exonuclease
MKALIDGDIVVYRAAASTKEDEDSWIAQARADQMIQEIIADTQSDSYEVFLTGTGNFRREIAPSYKANRPDERPTHWQAVREFLVTHHKAQICDGYEADDEMGIKQDKKSGSTVICSIDKDLLQIPGKHYNFVKKTFQNVTFDEGLKFLYLQSLIGDRSDNILGVAGIGPVKAERALAELLPEEWYDKCRELYNDDDRFHLNMKLLYIWQKPNDEWQPPTATTTGNEGATVGLHSTTVAQAKPITSSEAKGAEDATTIHS